MNLVTVLWRGARFNCPADFVSGFVNGEDYVCINVGDRTTTYEQRDTKRQLTYIRPKA